MAINRVNISSRSIEDTRNVTIQVLNVKPDINAILDPPEPPGKLVGFYNGSTGYVELYVVASSGTRLLKI